MTEQLIGELSVTTHMHDDTGHWTNDDLAERLDRCIERTDETIEIVKGLTAIVKGLTAVVAEQNDAGENERPARPALRLIRGELS